MLNRKIEPQILPINNINIPFPEVIILKNGIKLNVINAGNEDVVRFDVIINGGQWTQDRALQATFTNRMLREGSTNLTSAQIAEKLDYYGAWLDLSSSTNCNFVTLYSLNKYFPKTIEILSEIVKKPSFNQKEFSVVVENNKQQFIVNSTKVDNMARRKLSESLFGNTHPLGKFANLNDYETITTEDLKRFYTKNFHSGNCTLFVSGKVTQDIIVKIKEMFGNDSWGNVSSPTLITDVKPNTSKEKKFFLPKDHALQSSLKMGCFMMDRKHPDFLKSRVLVTLFGGYFGSRLMSNIREDKGYTYGIGAGIISYPGYGVLMISTEAANEYIGNIINEVYIEMDKLCNEKVGEKELTMVKNYMIGDLCRSYEGPFSISEAWIYAEISKLGKDFYEKSLNSIKEINSDDILSLAQKYFCKQNLIEVVAGKKM